MATGKSPDFAERLRLFRTTRGLDQEEMGKLLGLKADTISQIERRRKQAGQSAMILFDLLEQSPLYAAKDRLPIPPLHDSNVEYDPKLIKNRKIPIYTFVQAGMATEYESLPAEWDDLEDYNGTDPKAFALRVAGDSMEPRFPEGTVITVEPQYSAQNGNLVVAWIRGQGATFKKYNHSGDFKMVTLTPFNHKHPTVVLPREDFFWICKVVSASQKL